MGKRLRIFFVLLSMSLGVWAQPTGWTESRRIDITENSGATLTNYQVKLWVNTQAEIAAGRMLATGDDIRFGSDCNGSTLLNHWIEGPMNDDSTVIWVKVPSLPGSATTSITMFFGNPLATSASAIQGTFVGPHSSTDSVASGASGGATSSQRGFRFAPTQDILVESFGKREPNGSLRYVTLFNYTTQAILRQTQVAGPAAQYSYSALSQPIWLTTGTQYVLELYQGASDGYYFGTSSQIGQHLTYFDMRYCNSCTQNTFPTNVLSNYHYGYPDLWYYTRQNVSPAPTVVIQNVGSVSVDATDFVGCAGTMITLGGSVTGNSGSYNCLWSGSASISDTNSCNPTAIVGMGSYYVLTVTDSVGCRGTDTAWVVNATPTISMTPDSSSICYGDSVTLMVSGSGTSFSWWPAATLSSSTAMTVTAWPSSTTDYACVTIDSASGCSNTDTVSVVVNQVVLSVPVSPLTVCTGNSVVINASGADTYGWSPATDLNTTSGSSVISTPSANITYTVTGTDTINSCVATASIVVEVVPNPTVTASFPTPFCFGGQDFTLTGGSPAGGTYSGPFVSNNMFQLSTAPVGTYEILYTFTDGNGCVGSDTATAVVDVCFAIDPASLVSVQVYPNPSQGTFTVLIGNSLETLACQVTDMVGKLVYTGEMHDGATTLELKEQPAGFYFLTLSNAVMHKTIRLEIIR